MTRQNDVGVANWLAGAAILAMLFFVFSGVDFRSIAQDLRSPPTTVGQQR